MSCVHPFQIPHVMFTMIKFSMKLVLRNQPALSFFMSMCGNLKKNLWLRMTSFCVQLILSILTSFVLLPLLIVLVKVHPEMSLLLIIQRTYKMSFHHLIIERTNLPFRIHLIFHLSFLETQRIEICVSHQPLYMIFQIMRMSMYISNFLVVVVVIFFLIHLITIMIHLLLIFLSRQSLMIYKLKKWKPLKLSRHFSLS